MSTAVQSASKAGVNRGKIVKVLGPVVDVEFPEALPAIYNALTCEFKVQNEPTKVKLEVQQHLGDRWIRAISMSGTEGLKRGFDSPRQAGIIAFHCGIFPANSRDCNLGCGKLVLSGFAT